MKQIILVLFAAILVQQAFAQEQKLKENEVPASVKTNFAKAFPTSSKVKWEKEKADYEVNFMNDGTEMSATYDNKGQLIETEAEIKISELPTTAADYLKEHYKGINIKEATKITKANGTIMYEAEVNKKDVLFDSKGNLVPQREK